MSDLFINIKGRGLNYKDEEVEATLTLRRDENKITLTVDDRAGSAVTVDAAALWMAIEFLDRMETTEFSSWKRATEAKHATLLSQPSV